ncbi:MAG: ribosome biogenesis GTP-binding protein YihA/YsxC [Spirochaetales bacterium]|nr:ribosome biogenesis GTP-binding protein YihA/YsxC [Spirochaetales bacterium]
MSALASLLKSMKFMLSSPSYSSLPKDYGVEVAFAGRSNAGKSSVLNALANRKALAKTSSVPGKTRHINLFSLTDDQEKRLADLPGYGYAKVDAREQARWGEELTRYITERESLKGVVIVMDMRHPLTENDKQMVILCRTGDKPVHVLLNKADKLKANKRAAIKKSFEKELAILAPGASYSIFSAVKGDGIPELRSAIARFIDAS